LADDAQEIIANITAQTPTSGMLDRRDELGRAAGDGAVARTATVLVTCLDVTDTARVERILRERNEALEPPAASRASSSPTSPTSCAPR